MKSKKGFIFITVTVMAMAMCIVVGSFFRTVKQRRQLYQVYINMVKTDYQALSGIVYGRHTQADATLTIPNFGDSIAVKYTNVLDTITIESTAVNGNTTRIATSEEQNYGLAEIVNIERPVIRWGTASQ